MVVSIKLPSEEYKQRIASAITEGITHLLGENGTRMVFYYAGLKQIDLDDLDANEIYGKLGDLIPCIRRIFGPGSIIIERRITAILTAAESGEQNFSIRACDERRTPSTPTL